MIVVTGATGNVGRPLVAALTAAGEEVVAVSRGAAPAGIRHHRADLADVAGLRPVLDGADALFLLVPGAGEMVDRAELARAAGSVKRIVLVSSQAVRTRPEAASHAPLRALEETVRRAGPEWTVLRPGGFASNAFAWAESVRGARTVAAPFADVALPAVDPADVAAVAAVALAGGHAGRTYELTGPEASTPRQRAAAIGRALGAELTFVELSRAEAAEGMRRFMPEPVVEGTLSIIGTPTADEQRVSPDVERVLGRPPRAFAAWAADNVAAFRPQENVA